MLPFFNVHVMHIKKKVGFWSPHHPHTIWSGWTDVEDDPAEPKGGIKHVISIASLHTHKRSKSTPLWIPFTLIYHLFGLTISSSDSCAGHKLAIKLYIILNCLDFLIFWCLTVSMSMSLSPFLHIPLLEIARYEDFLKTAGKW